MKTPLKILIVVGLGVAVGGTLWLKQHNSSAVETDGAASLPNPTAGPTENQVGVAQVAAAKQASLPRLVDLGADKCIPCKAMAPILEELKTGYAGRIEVEFIDVWKDPKAGKAYQVEMIPTQIFYDHEGRELFRHVGFYGKEDILAKWGELGVDLGDGESVEVVREEPIQPDARSSDRVCFLCDGDVDPTVRTLVKGEAEQRVLCSPHCYFITFTSIVGAEAEEQDAKVWVTDSQTGEAIAAVSATYLYGMDSKGRPTIGVFGSPDAAEKDRHSKGGIVMGWEFLRSKELATRCGFCDRAVYPEDASKVIVDGTTHTYGCCTHCALGVAARTGKDIAVEAYDGLTGETIRVKTLNGMIASIEPATATAWFGQKKNTEGKWVSAGCFQQGFFRTRANLQGWLDARPAMTGREISIAQALANKMKLTPEQIAKACKLGECQ